VGGHVYIDDAELVQSTDAGNTWNRVFYRDGNYPVREFISATAINSDGTALGGTKKVKEPQRLGERYEYTYGIIRSTDFGATWNNVDFQNLQEEIIDFVWNSSNEVFAITSQNLLQSADNGLTWFYSSETMPSQDLRCITINSRNDIYIGTGNAGVFVSEDKGSSWRALNVGITDTAVNVLAISPEGFLFAGTEYHGIFRSITPVQSPRIIPPPVYKLSQNYPNPFNPNTNIQYAVGSRQFVSLKVYDLLGREVTTLVNEEKPAGSYEVDFSASSLASGIYFYRLEAGSFIETKKLILLK
jgi:photosystem II stability/assembly factor-like uncharacterized protein